MSYTENLCCVGISTTNGLPPWMLSQAYLLATRWTGMNALGEMGTNCLPFQTDTGDLYPSDLSAGTCAI